MIPMHFKTPKINLNIAPLEDFLDVMADTAVKRPGATSIEITTRLAPREPDDRDPRALPLDREHLEGDLPVRRDLRHREGRSKGCLRRIDGPCRIQSEDSPNIGRR